MPTFADTRTEKQVAEDAAYKERVLAGIRLLEQKYGLDWVDKIDLDTLNLADVHCCVLGQLYDNGTRNGYYNGLRTLNLYDTEGEATRYGFSTDHSYNKLQRAWETAIKARRAVG